MGRQLDIAIAVALGHKVINGSYHVTWVEDKKNKALVNPSLYSVPKHSTDGNAMVELVAEMQKRGLYLNVYFSPKNNEWTAIFESFNYEKTGVGHAELIPEAVARAAYKALTGEEWEGDGKMADLLQEVKEQPPEEFEEKLRDVYGLCRGCPSSYLRCIIDGSCRKKRRE